MNDAVLDRPPEEDLDQIVHPEVADAVLRRLKLPFSRTRLYTGEATLREVQERLLDNPNDTRYQRFLEDYLQELWNFIGEGQ